MLQVNGRRKRSPFFSDKPALKSAGVLLVEQRKIPPLSFHLHAANTASFLVQRHKRRYFSGSTPPFFRFNAVNTAIFPLNAVNAAFFPVKRR